MDPLSVTASFIAVLQVANAVISICYDYSASAKSSSRELSRIIEEIKALRNVLESLIHLAERAETPDLCIQSRLPTLRGLCEPEMGPLSQCLEEMRALEKKLVPPTWGGPIGSKRRALIQALGWPLKEKDTLRTLEKIGRFKATLCLGIMADQS
ncbi:hypothetical protein MMC12_001077 [Toensbergia leucococca]|nr:hypothetical protein [Toensbergia leucococca]